MQKLNVVDTSALQYPKQFILPKVVDRRKLPTKIDDLDMEDPDYHWASPRGRIILFETYEEELA